ncbi:universal stress protein [Halococcus sp. PRR34]|uniref:universal stress protein n=1 Tax=Halococcus sp. PRR34 TaxID=3020830 RepID=UPI00236078D4|nr:universal stress protein [Halococcus sp. PRR34]
MYDDILLPTDGSEGNRRAIDHAIAIADEIDATVHALHVVNTSEYDGLERSALDSLEASGTDALENVEDAASRISVEVETHLEHGSPYRKVLAAVDDVDADTIIMGTSGRTGLNRLLLGSVAERVVREATVPVTTVRAIDEPMAVDSPTAAVEHAASALADAGHEPAEAMDDPYRGTSSWVVPYRAEDGRFRVHIDGATGATRIGRSGLR